MTSKRIAITFGVLWISACSSGIPASEEASDIAQSAAVGAATDASVSEALLEKTMAESNAKMEASEAPIVVGNARLYLGQPTIDHPFLSCHVRGIVGGQKADDLCDFTGLSQPAHGDHCCGGSHRCPWLGMGSRL